MTDLRKIAQGKPCMVRIPAVCNFDPATTVLAHYSMMGISGRGVKSPDILGAWACSDCHAAIDGVTHKDKYGNEFMRNEVRLAHAEGVMRTQYELMKLGKL